MALYGIAAALLLMMGLQIASVRGDSQTYDEAVHLAAGFSYLKTGDFRLNPEHPPLAKILAALPLLALHPALDTTGEAWKRAQTDQGQEWIIGKQFVYDNRVSADTLLLRGRSVTIALALVLGIAIAVWTWITFGRRAAFLAAVLFSLDPTVIAHGRYITTDVCVTLFFFLACISWNSYVLKPTWHRLIIAGIALGLALLSKFSALLLFPIFLALSVIRYRQELHEGAFRCISWRHHLLSLVAAGGIAMATVYAGYAFETKPVVSRDDIARVRVKLPGTLNHLVDTRLGSALFTRVPIPGRTFITSIVGVSHTIVEGRSTYLLGKVHPNRLWYYFPAAFIFKEPLATIALCVAAIVLAAREMVRWRGLKQLRFHWFTLLVPTAAYLAMSLSVRFNIGIRHLLPVFPFLFVFTGAVLARLRTPWIQRAVLLAVGLLALESVNAYPRYVAFFNVVVPNGGVGFLSDSNLDWGQDVKRLKTYLQLHQIRDLCGAYFGTADLSYYGIRFTALPVTGDRAQIRSLNCVAFVSVSARDLFPGRYDWLKARKPVARVGSSFDIFDLRKRELDPIQRLGAVSPWTTFIKTY